MLAALGSRLAAAFPPGRPAGPHRRGRVRRPGARPAAAPAPTTCAAALEQPLRVAGFDIHPDPLHRRGARPRAAPTRRRRPSCCAAPNWRWNPPRAAGRGGAAAYGRGLESDGLSRLALEGDLRGALGRGEIVPFYQPIVRLSTGAISGFEALVRWRHPRRGLLMPDEFLPLCDEMGLMDELGAHDDARRRPAAGRLARAPTAPPAS